MSLSTVHTTLSSLKTCQADIGTGMDIVTDVALDLAETAGAENEAGLEKLELMMLDCAKLDREINCFVGVVECVTAENQPETMFNLKSLVKDKFTEIQSRLSDEELQNHNKLVSFKESVRNALKTVNSGTTANTEEELDEDIAVTQSDVNFTCPLTQVDMVNPMKNKKCNHHYDQDAILEMIRNRLSQKKKLRCPVVGCDNTDVKQGDLVLDQMMKRQIQRKQSSMT
ncbi:E3 SUMO-protein ligase NSE2 isoform X1 [Esox lucius]|uniref:E3 SUMO-protein ligase NSE2 isoform X1 n=1 Tax=Esox lucius TaxID=8010 RepID=UPI0005763CD9|nr:E3 SUMO-protein ligase NSE2 isoform X1 [Esox lucius]XP_010891062.1 E3 SUMO-protein ligase NSE2 isoform X1 [Esox lucius]